MSGRIRQAAARGALMKALGGALVALGAASALAAPPAPPPAAAPAAANDGRIRVQLMARQAVTLSGELSAKIASLPVPEGGGFRKGQVLVEFDCDSYRAQLAKAQAAQEAASQLLEVNQQLVKLNSAGTLETTQAQGRAKETAAELSYMKTVVNKCAIYAPFAGRVARRVAAVHQYVSPGNPVLDIVDAGPLELRMLVPSKWLAQLKPGSRFTVAVDELGSSFPARIERLGAQIDPVSQSVLAVGVVDGAAPALLPGMSGWASFK
ncbi:efflux RND transporter periplasmic adaptor subunit [Pelomonas sp. CA6]|uniref:efflux RND transporter periplasmic adaptor subunit n=1 Tax=Pelomonas sp. CA6 TaxID=2907999 RepID=UPI001F4BF475|nr:efflux RND transporter periplasmic adaptor subunit [Pelomonas sp. CA6]MCH7344274.1 efflux RND transporter periplasmic adaptor subunit [Pelomonas sp. CA6]